MNYLKRIRFIRKSNQGPIWLFRCRCGVEKELRLYAVKSNQIMSCGYLKREVEKYPKYKWQTFFHDWMCDHELGQNSIGLFDNEGLEEKVEDGYFDEKDIEMTNIVLDEFAEPALPDTNGYRCITMKVWW